LRLERGTRGQAVGRFGEAAGFKDR